MPDVVPDGKRPRSILNQRTRTPASFEIADANASVSNITFPDEDLDLHEVGGAGLTTPPRPEEAFYLVCRSALVVYPHDDHHDAAADDDDADDDDDDGVGGGDACDNMMMMMVMMMMMMMMMMMTVLLLMMVLKKKQMMMMEAVAHYRVYIAMNDRGLDRILAAPQSPVGTNFGDVPAETILPYCAQASGDQSANVRPIALQVAQPTVVLVHSVSTLSEQTTPTWKNVSDTNFQVTNVQLEDLDLDFQQLGGMREEKQDIPYQESLVTHYMVYFGRLIYSYGTDTDGDWFINTASKDT
ncbi:unnamed protein product [Symbiodinium sp. KB8]|nr:unnamed protein product [Symbiodinium sp. KB8]